MKVEAVVFGVMQAVTINCESILPSLTLIKMLCQQVEVRYCIYQEYVLEHLSTVPNMYCYR